jgi:NADPH2:quinone reductase
MKAIQIQQFGGPEMLEQVEVEDPSPRLGEVVVEITRSGVNFADTHATRNDYLAEQSLPLIPGTEIAGRTSDGRRFAALMGSGGYAERVAVPQASLIPIPEGVDDDQAAAVLLQGLTALALVHRCARREPGETVVIEAAAGGTGTLAVQLAKRAGARVIGLASSEEKREAVRRLGADACIDSGVDAESLGAAIREANDGKRVDAVLHMSGGEAFDAELGVLAPLGRMVVFGIASREQRQVSTAALLRGSKSVVGFWLAHLMARADLLGPMIEQLLGAAAAGELKATIGEVYPLSEARRAHEDLIARRTTGKLLLDPSR